MENESSIITNPAKRRLDGQEHPSMSFLNLPPEVRLIIFRLCLIGQREMLKPNGKPPSKSTADFPLAPGRAKAITATLQRIPHPCVRPESSRSYSGADSIVISLLRISKLIHQEAAAVLYGENTFQFIIGDSRGHGPIYDVVFDLGIEYHVGIEDNLTRLAPMYMRMIKRFELAISLPNIEWMKARDMFLKYKARIASAANAFGGNDHSLQGIRIRFIQGFTQNHHYIENEDRPDYRYELMPYIRCCHHILEPLATIYGVKESVSVEGVVPDFAARLETAMTSQFIACVPIGELYKIRIVKIKGRKTEQRYSLGRYYDSKFAFPIDVERA